MIKAPLARALMAVLICASSLESQSRAEGPTVIAGRSALFAPSTAGGERMVLLAPSAPCGSHLKNAALLGLGVSLAVGVLELTYTLIREPFVRRGHDLPAADPTLIAWGGGVGFAIGLVGTELCRRRRR